MTVKDAVVAAVSLVASSVATTTAAQQWTGAQCEISASHYLVQGAVQYLKNATETKFQDKRVGYLKDANRVLSEAVTTKGQDKNPAAWYYFGRYYALTNDLSGADTAFTKALALAPQCQQDIMNWRRIFWVPVFNDGVKAWQAGNTDSAIAAFRRADQIYQGEPAGFIYLATLLANANQTDSAAKYFRLAVPAASDPKFTNEKRNALFNVARVYHAAQRYDEAAAGYKGYLTVYPGDPQALAGLAAVYAQQGKRDEAEALYGQILEHADSAEPADLFSTAQQILNAIPNDPDTAPIGSKCRAATRARNKTLTVKQVATRCAAVTDDTIKAFRASITPRYRLAARAYEAGLVKNPSLREALYNLGGIYYLLSDTAKVLPVAQRLYAVDPMNRTSLAKLAGAWQLRGNKDSTLHYLTIADSLTLEVTVGTFAPDEQGAKLDGLVTNLKAKPSLPVAVTFEFLNAKGEVVGSPQKQDVPAIDPSGNHAFEIKGAGPGIVAWRYRKSS